MKLTKNRRFFEGMLIGIVFALACLALGLHEYKLVVLNLFYLPVILSGYYLGRNNTCVLALLSALSIAIVTAVDPAGFAPHFTPVLGGVALALWASVLGLAAILIGTLCDERASVVDELHEAYVGVVEVLSRYLQGGNPKVKARSIRVAELAQAVAAELRLPRKHVDEIRVGALLHDLGNVEITTRVLARAVDTLEASPSKANGHTFAGMDLVHSLGSVLHGTVPLLLGQDDYARMGIHEEDEVQPQDTPLGARIIRMVRAYDALAGNTSGEPQAVAAEAIKELRNDRTGTEDDQILRALERVVLRNARTNRAHSYAELRPV
ncbi:MAG: HD-GYP domain-containing protein [Phycisphaerae bacterium]